MRRLLHPCIVLNIFTSALLVSCGYKEAQLKDQESVQALIQSQETEVQACYKDALRRNPLLPSGSMTIRAEQAWDGRLQAPQLIKGFAGSNEVFSCLETKIQSWKTTPPKTWGPVELTWEFKNTEMIRNAALSDFGSNMKENQPLFAECFEREVRKSPSVTGGEIKFEFLRTADGRVQKIRKTDGFAGSDPIYSCMAQIISQFELAPVPEDTQMHWAYRFNRLDRNIAEGNSSSKKAKQ